MEKDNNKICLIIIAILLFIVGIGIGYIIGTNKNNTLTILEEEKEKIEEKEEKKILDSGILVSRGKKESVKLELNGIVNKLSLYDGSYNNEKSFITFGDTNLDRIVRFGTGNNEDYEMPEVYFYEVAGTDKKEYLIVTYNDDFQHILLVLNDKTEIIGDFSNKINIDNKYECFATFNKSDEKIFIKKNDGFYYYKYINNNIKDVTNFEDDSIKLVLTKLEIGNNIVKETKKEEEKSGKFKMCT